MESMPVVILDASLRAAALALAVWAVLKAARVQDAALKHAAWRGLLYAALLLPLLSLALPEIPLRIPLPAQERLVAAETVPPAAPAPDPRAVLPRGPSLSPGNPGVPVSEAAERPAAARWQDIAFAAWALVAAAFLVQFGARTLRARAIARHAAPTGLAPHILESAEIDVPAACGVFRPLVLLPADWRDWPAAKLRAVLAHEEAHIRRGDALTMGLAEIYRALAWFHPLAWWLRRELADLAEQVADDRALAVTDRAEYAELLLGFFAARSGFRLEGVSMAAPSSHAGRRIERILEAGRRLSHGVSLPVALALAAAGLPLVWITASAQPARPLPPQTPPPAAAPPRAPGAPLAPMPPPPAEGIRGGVWGGVRGTPFTSHGSEENFVILDGSSRTMMSGSHWDLEHARAIAKKLGVPDLIWFRREGSVQVITDRATIEAARALWKSPGGGDARERAAEETQRKLELEMERLHARMEQVKVPLPDLTSNLDNIRKEMVRAQKEATMEDVSRLQEMVGHLQEEIGRQQEVFGRKHEDLSREMEKLSLEMEKAGRVHEELSHEMGRHAERATRELTKLLDAAIARKLAQPEPR